MAILKVGHAADGLLTPDDPAPFTLFNADGASPFLLIGDHAGMAIPQALGDLGMDACDLARHIAIDIGVSGMGQALARLIDAPFLHQNYSRLVIDCNRDPNRADAMPTISDGVRITGNEGLDETTRRARIAAIHAPYHAAIDALIEARRAAGRDPILLSLHSFTPIMDGVARPWDIGILYWRGRIDAALALADQMRSQAGITVGDNVPYAMDDTDYTVPRHAFPRDLRYAEIEVRQDLVDTPAGQHHWARRLADSCKEIAAP